MENIKITDLLDISIMQKIQDNFSKYTRMASIMTDENGIPITKPSNFTRFCNELVRKTKLGAERCEECDHMGAVRTMESGKTLTYTCHSGIMVDFAAPIMVEGSIIGSFIGGQARVGNVDEKQARDTAKELGIDPEEYISAAREVPLVPRDRVDMAAEFLYELTHMISEMAYNNYKALKVSRKHEQTARMQTEYVVRLCESLKVDISDWMKQARNAVGDERRLWMLSSTLQSEGENVLVKIEDTVEYIRSSDGRIQLREAEYRVREMLRGIIATVRKQFPNERSHFELSVDDSVPEIIFGDAGHLGQMLFILLQNSIRFAGEGMIRIRASAKRISYSTWIILDISNPGVFVEAESMRKLSEFFSGEMSLVLDDAEGVQLGLAQVGRLVRQMYGEIEAESTADQEFRIQIRIPQLSLAGE